jgi:hypothetical protein
VEGGGHGLVEVLSLKEVSKTKKSLVQGKTINIFAYPIRYTVLNEKQNDLTHDCSFFSIFSCSTNQRDSVSDEVIKTSFTYLVL